MRQIVIPEYGPPEVLEVRESPDPDPGPGELRVRVGAAGINFADILARMGLYPEAPALPAVVGFEAAGRVDAVGEGVERSWIDTAVVVLRGHGCHADTLCVSEERVFRRPEGMRVEEGAALPVVYLTAHVALSVMGSLSAGERVLVHNAGGGVGLAALDLCRIRGATAYGTASAWKHDEIRDRGAAETIDYRSRDFEEEIERITGGAGVHLVLDPLGGASWKKSYRCLCPTGRLVVFGLSAGATGRKRSWLRALRAAARVPWLTLNPLRLLGDCRAVVGVNLQRVRERPTDARRWMERLFVWWREGELRPRVDATFPFDEAAAAHRYIQDRRNLGKVLLVPE